MPDYAYLYESWAEAYLEPQPDPLEVAICRAAKDLRDLADALDVMSEAHGITPEWVLEMIEDYVRVAKRHIEEVRDGR